MIAKANVEEIDMVNKIAIVNREIVEKQNDIYVVKTKRYKEKLDLELTPNLKIGDKVAVHLGYVAGKLTEGEASNLSFWTRKVVKLI
jgi:hydrogenase maturation factor